MNRNIAEATKIHALRAIAELNSIAALQADWSGVEIKGLRRAIGMAICTIDDELLDRVYKAFPDLNDLTDTLDTN
jgi:hypothetical protein